MTATSPRLTWATPSGLALGALRGLVRSALLVPVPARPSSSPPDLDANLDGLDQAAPDPPSSPARRRRVALPWHRLGLLGVVLLSAFLNLYRLDREGNANQYYTATVFSMLQSWHTFFFASFDPGGFVTVDKPPLGFWIQAASAKLLEAFGVGFSGLSVLLPEALAGVASVALLYHLVRRAAGPTVGLIAALALAVTPVSVAVSRNNTIDASLVLVLLLAVWAAFRATERGSLGWLLASAALVGLGFEIKMMQAYLAAPAIYLLYLVAAPRARLVRIGHLALASVVLLVVSLAWPVAVDLTPADQRPYIGSTQDNSAVNLAIGYNGLERLLGHGMTPQRLIDNLTARLAAPSESGASASAVQAVSPDGANADGGQPAAGNGGPGVDGRGGPGDGGPGGIGENGPAGPLRLVNQQLGPQASWLLPLALAGMLAAGWSVWTRRRTLASDPRGQALLLWGTWLLTAGGFFSVAGYFHSYYLVMLGPPVAALAAIGVQGDWEAYRRSRLLALLLPLGLVGTASLQAYLLLNYPEWASVLTPLALGGTALAGLVLLGVRLARRVFPDGSRRVMVARGAATLGVIVLLAAPAIWAGYPSVGGQTVGGLPSAGPRGMGRFGGPFGGPGGGPDGGPFGGPGFGGPNGGPAGAPGFGGLGFPGPNGGPPPDDGFAGGPPDGARADGFGGGANGAGRQARQGGPNGFGGPGNQGGPDGGPGGPGPGGFGGPGGPGARADQLAYLQAQQGSTTFLVATGSANQAAPIILETGQPVMALGGFLGSDPILTVDGLIAKIRANEVRFFLLDGRGGPGGPGGPGGRSELTSWVQSTCTAVPASALAADPGADAAANDTPSGLYDCAGVQASPEVSAP